MAVFKGPDNENVVAEVEHLTTPTKKPIVKLPRGAQDEHSVEIFVEIGSRAAGCVICTRPIPGGTSRLRVKVFLRAPNKTGPPRQWESYYMHPACITDRIRPEVLRGGYDCYECGAMPPSQTDDGLVFTGMWDARCFTTSKFAPASLCPKCTEKPMWLGCNLCQTYYPVWMLSVAENFTATLNGAALGTYPGPSDICNYCADRYSITRKRELEAEAEEWEKTREAILRDGL